MAEEKWKRPSLLVHDNIGVPNFLKQAIETGAKALDGGLSDVEIGPVMA